MTPTNLPEWLSWMEGLKPRRIKLGLERIAAVTHSNGLNQFACPVITVAGTNGKGSTVAFVEQILLAAGYRVGSTYSPHLHRYNERICLNGKPVDDKMLCETFKRIRLFHEERPLTYFEFSILAALDIFQRSHLDAVVLEVGLGGRLDATNVVDADIAVITSIDFDHMDYLGNTREAIGYEKAGIFREKKLAVCGEPDIPSTITQVAEEKQTTLYHIGRDFNYTVSETDWAWSHNDICLTLPKPTLLLQNAATALMAINLLQSKLNIPVEAIKAGLQNATLPGRYERRNKPYEMIFDVTHNPHAARLLAKRLSAEPPKRTLAIVGMLNTKDILGTLKPLRSIIDHWYLANLAIHHTAPAQHLAEALKSVGISQCQLYPSIPEACHIACSDCDERDRLVVFGSFHTVAEVQAWLT